MIDEYTKLLEVAAESDNDKVAGEAVTKLIAHLKSQGRVRMLGDILRELRKIEGRRKASEPVLEVAHEKEGAAALRAAAKAGIEAKEVHVNHSLIRGWRARGAGLLVDHSAKSALLTIYQNVTG